MRKEVKGRKMGRRGKGRRERERERERGSRRKGKWIKKRQKGKRRPGYSL